MKNQFFTWMCILLSIVVKAQNAGDIDPTFKIGKSFSTSGTVGATVVQTDGKIIAGGSFVFYDDKTVNNIVRLKPDGTIDATFNSGTGFAGDVESMAIQPDGKILVGGTFTSYNGTPVVYLTRLNSDGTIDSIFNKGGTGFQDYFRFHLYSIAIQPDGKILAAGRLSSYNGMFVGYVIRLNADGTIDPSFNPKVANDTFLDLVTIDSSGKILVSGFFLNSSGSGYDNIVRLNTDGTLDPTFKISILNSTLSITSIAFQSDGKIIAAGSFSIYDTTPANGIIRLNQDGTVDKSFNTVAGPNSSEDSVAIEPDDKIVVAGSHVTLNGLPIWQAIRLNKDGSIDPTFSNSLITAPGVDKDLRSISLLSDGNILFGGYYKHLGNKNISCLAKVNSNGVLDPTYNVKNALFNIPGYSVNCLSEQQDGKIIVCGNFDYYFNTLSSRIVRLNQDGTIDGTFLTGFGSTDDLSPILMLPDGKILAGGLFYGFGGTNPRYLMRLNPDGSIDSSFDLGTAFNSFVKSLCLQPDGKIIIGGAFSSYNGINTKSLVRLNPNGSLDNSFNANTSDNFITAIAFQTDGKILVGGNNFTRLNSDGTSDTSFNSNVGSGFTVDFGTPSIQNIIIQPDARIIVCGNFSKYNGMNAPGFLRLNNDGTVDNTFSTAIGVTNSIKFVALQSSGKIAALASLSTGQTKILRLNQNGTLDISLDGGILDSYTTSLLIQKDQKILIGGAFGKYNNIVCQGLVRLMGDSALGNKTFTKSNFSIYPNPASYLIKIQSPENFEIDKIIVTDLAGKTVLKLKNTKEINVESLSTGMYIIKVYSGEINWQSKFIKE